MDVSNIALIYFLHILRLKNGEMSEFQKWSKMAIQWKGVEYTTRKTK